MVHNEYDFEVCNSKMRPIAEALVKKYEELKYVDPSKILFVLNSKSKSADLASTAKIPHKWTEILFQLGACSFFHIIEFYEKTTSILDDNQITALLYRELRKITADGDVSKPDVNDWWTLIAGVGKNWHLPNSSCPNILDESADWKTLMGSYYEEPKKA